MGIGLLIVDYLQLMAPWAKPMLVQQVTEISRSLQSLRPRSSMFPSWHLKLIVPVKAAWW